MTTVGRLDDRPTQEHDVIADVIGVTSRAQPGNELSDADTAATSATAP